VRGHTIRYEIYGGGTVKLNESPGFDASDLGVDFHNVTRSFESHRNDVKVTP
jgi:hypothetical protein